LSEPFNTSHSFRFMTSLTESRWRRGCYLYNFRTRVRSCNGDGDFA